MALRSPTQWAPWFSIAAGSISQITLGGGGSINSTGNNTITMPSKGEVYVAVTGTGNDYGIITGSSGPTEEQYFIGDGGVATVNDQGGNNLIFVRQGGSRTLDGTRCWISTRPTARQISISSTSTASNKGARWSAAACR